MTTLVIIIVLLVIIFLLMLNTAYVKENSPVEYVPEQLASECIKDLVDVCNTKCEYLKHDKREHEDCLTDCHKEKWLKCGRLFPEDKSCPCIVECKDGHPNYLACHGEDFSFYNPFVQEWDGDNPSGGYTTLIKHWGLDCAKKMHGGCKK